jgi:Na+/melibiose symporter-like transporter
VHQCAPPQHAPFRSAARSTTHIPPAGLATCPTEPKTNLAGPYYNVYFLQKGLNETTIGSLSALRTWLPAIAAFMWSGVADKYQIHKILVLVGFIASTFLRTSLAFASSTLAFFVLVAASELSGAGVGPIIDASVVAACTEVGRPT